MRTPAASGSPSPVSPCFSETSTVFSSAARSSSPFSSSSASLPPTATSRTSSSSNGSSSSGNAADQLPPLFLRHILTCPPSDAIPLRNMYTSHLLLAEQQQRARTPSPAASQAKGARVRSPSLPGQRVPPRPDGQPAREPANAVEAMQFIPPSAQALPPSFITTFVRRVFPEDLCRVDFTQALTAMDYLKVLDDRKRRELAAVLRRLGFDVEMLGRSRDELRALHPRIAEWVLGIDEKGKRVEALYTQVYIGLRRWTLINEMRLTPFSKHNCIAMLNALYPPHYPAPPTTQLTETILNTQRNAFFRYIQIVEKSGRGVLAGIETSGSRPGDANGWPVVRDLVDVYLTRANELIEECMSVSDAGALGGSGAKRADSGVSFSSLAYDSSRGSASTGYSSLSDKPLPPQPAAAAAAPPKTPCAPPPAPAAFEDPAGVLPPMTPGRKKMGRLESFARELRRIKSRSADHRDEVDLRAAAAAKSQSRGLRKMRSASALTREGNSKVRAPSAGGAGGGGGGGGRATHSRGHSAERVGPLHAEIDDAQRARLLREARRDREARAPKRAASPLPPPVGPLAPAAVAAAAARPLGHRAVTAPEKSPMWSHLGGAPHPHDTPPVPFDIVPLPEPRLGQPAFPAELSA